MTIAVLGANGQIGRVLIPKLTHAGHNVRGLIRDDAQASTIQDAGAEPVVGDLEGPFDHVLDGCDAVVFTAGSGGKTGGDKTLLVDLWGALRSYEACHEKGIQRYVMVSALKVDSPDRGPASIRHYLVAKRIADEYLQRSGLDYTICRPGRLLNAPGRGRVDVRGQRGNPDATVAREDVATVLAACIAAPNTIGKTFDLAAGDTLIADAIESV